MRTIHYIESQIITGNAIAEAVLEYARVLAYYDVADTIEIPTIDADGNRIMAQMLIGPASQLVNEEAPGDDDIVDEDVLADLRRRTQEHAPSRPAATRAEDLTVLAED